MLGATGAQGGAVAAELLRRGVSVWVTTTDSDLPAAGALVVRGSVDDRASARRLTGVRRVFAIQDSPAGGVPAEIRQGVAVADAAHRAGVDHVVYCSADGAQAASGVPRFEAKALIEEHMLDLGLPLTIVRSVMVMDHLVAPGRGDARRARGDRSPTSG